MVFSSIPAYLDPANWQQQQQPNYETGNSTGTSTAHHFHPPPPPPPPPPQPHGVGSGTGSIRPGSMADRARMANLPMPEVAVKCPRCESSNTKFCYFNNYSLSQPRHFCKMCRRYWTRGGALRNVPVGGGCRRNKRSSKGSSSNNSKSSPVSSSSGGGGGGATTSHVMLPSNSSSGPADIIGLGPQFPPLRFMGSNLHYLTDNYGSTGEIGLNFGGINFPGSMAASTGDINFFLGNSSSGGGGASYLSAGGMEHQWRLPQTHQFPFLAAGGMDLSHGLYPVEGGGVGGVVHEPAASYGGGVRPKTTSEMAHDQDSSVKTELTQDMNMSRQFLGIPGNEQYWSGTTAAWTDLSGFSSSSTSHPL